MRLILDFFRDIYNDERCRVLFVKFFKKRKYDLKNGFYINYCLNIKVKEKYFCILFFYICVLLLFLYEGDLF